MCVCQCSDCTMQCIQSCTMNSYKWANESTRCCELNLDTWGRCIDLLITFKTLFIVWLKFLIRVTYSFDGRGNNEEQRALLGFKNYKANIMSITSLKNYIFKIIIINSATKFVFASTSCLRQYFVVPFVSFVKFILYFLKSGIVLSYNIFITIVQCYSTFLHLRNP